MRVPADYLKECCERLSSISTHPKLQLEKEDDDPKSSEPLSQEAGSRYRSLLDRLAWWGQ